MQRGSVILALVGGACGATRPCPAPADPDRADPVAAQWTQVATDYGEIAIPVGWSIRASQSPDPVFDLYSPDPALAVFVLPVSPQGEESSIEEALRRQLLDLHPPAGLLLRDQPEGWQYAEVSADPRHVVAACAVRYEAKGPVAVLALTYLMSGGAIPRSLYDQAGGRETLCGIAASARRLQLVAPDR